MYAHTRAVVCVMPVKEALHGTRKVVILRTAHRIRLREVATGVLHLPDRALGVQTEHRGDIHLRIVGRDLGNSWIAGSFT